MLKINTNAATVAGAFGITPENLEELKHVTWSHTRKDIVCISKLLRRIWIDETITDNVKCWAIFQLGVWYQEEKEKGV